MQRIAVLILAAGMTVASLGAADVESSKNALVTAHAELGTTPEGALKLWFDAVYLYLDEGTRDQGREALGYLTIPFKSDKKWERRPSFSTFVTRLRDPAYAHIFRSYAVGTSPENTYLMNPLDYQLAVVESAKDSHGRGHRVVIRSSGADSARPVYMKRSTSTGLWYVSEFANVYVGIRPPLKPGVEQFE